MSKTTWNDAREGDAVQLAGREWRVVKLKRDGKRAKVTVEHKGRTAKSVVRLKDRVEIAPRSPVQDRDGTQRRWATEPELAEALRTPPAPAEGGLWDTPATKAEKLLGRILEARLIGESKDEAAGYYVPPVDVSTIASHLLVFHDGAGLELPSEKAMIAQHTTWHEAAAEGQLALPVNHWHTERRP